MNIPLNTEGRISNTKYPGHHVLVKEDIGNTGGFLVFEWWENSDGPNENGAFDCWVEDLSSLKRFFDESAWVVIWGNESTCRP
jgi:hypothetical protein